MSFLAEIRLVCEQLHFCKHTNSDSKKEHMNKKDKKFIAALVLTHTGLLIATISLSGRFWHNQFQECRKVNHLYELSQYMKGEINEAHSDTKVKKLKQHYQTKGVRAEEH